MFVFPFFTKIVFLQLFFQTRVFYRQKCKTSVKILHLLFYGKTYTIIDVQGVFYTFPFTLAT